MHEGTNGDGGGGDSRSLAAPAAPATVGAFLRAIERVEEVIDQETHALRHGEAIDLGEFNRRKSHGLLELTRGIRNLKGPEAERAIEQRLRPLRAKLDENSALLRRHLDAVHEISNVLARAIRDGESDGTYTAGIRFASARQ
jgi:hypothetical protein